MRGRIKKLLMMLLTTTVVVTSMPATQVQATEINTEEQDASVSDGDLATVTFGTLGDNNGVEWSYDIDTKTLTITGEDSGVFGDYWEGSPFNGICSDVENIIVQDCKLTGSVEYLFAKLGSLKSIEFVSVDTSEVTDMSDMFAYCSSLTSLNVSSFDTSKVTDMNSMFYCCGSVENLDVSAFDTGNVVNMYAMFADCSSLTSLTVNGFDTGNVTDISAMFSGCSSLASLNISSFDTSKVTTMGGMFYGCNNLVSLDVSGFDTSNVTDMGYMFNNCRNLVKLDLSNFITNKTTTMVGMFYGCGKLASLDVNSFDTSRVTNMNSMFAGCSSLTSLNVSGFDTSNVTDMGYMFFYCSSLESLDISSFDTSGAADVEGMLAICTNLQTIHTPKAMTEGQTIVLPETYYDTRMNGTTELTQDNCNMMLAREWKPHNITYFVNGGINNSDNPTTYTQVSDTIVLKNPTRTGYTFGGWYTESTYENKVTKIDAESTGDITLYAKWTANKYTIKFNGNGSTSGTMSSMSSRAYGSSYTLTANVFKRTGYTFTGWNTKADGSGTSYADKASVKNLTATSGGTVTLYAQWKKNTYKITYTLNGGTNNSSNPATYTVTTATITLKNPTRTGYTFGGWYSDSKFTQKVTQIPEGSTGSKTLYAKWTANKYTIKFNGNSATGGTMSSMSNRVYGTSYTLTANAFKRTGYTFTGWNTRANGSGTSYANKASVKNLTATSGGTVTLYAQWKKNTYTITYKLNSGKNTGSNPSTYTVTTATITLKNPTRTGYTFGGWYSDSKCTKKVTTIPKGSTGNKTLYAKWTANKYTIKYNGNGATGGSMSNQKNRKYGTSYNLAANKFTRTGYTFVGWNTKKNGSGTDYSNKASVKNLTTTNGKTVTLYAQWEKKTYKITYKLNGGTNSSKNPKTYTVTTKTITLNKPTRSGYTFGGWYSDSKCTKKVTKIPKGSTGNLTLYAKWIKN